MFQLSANNADRLSLQSGRPILIQSEPLALLHIGFFFFFFLSFSRDSAPGCRHIRRQIIGDARPALPAETKEAGQLDTMVPGRAELKKGSRREILVSASNISLRSRIFFLRPAAGQIYR